MQYKNPGKSKYQQYSVGYEEQQQLRVAPKRMYSPKYSTQNSDQYSPRNQSSQLQTGSPRHWKSYLAPELTRMSPREAEIEYQSQQLHDTGSSRLKGYSSVYNLRQGETSNASLGGQMREEERGNGQYGGNNSQNGRKEQYSRRKEEIMNRIKLLQQRAVAEQDRPQSPGQHSQVRILTAGNPEQLASRVAALEQRVEGISAEFQSKLRRELTELERRLRAELKPK